jgi:hypothetical protein
LSLGRHADRSVQPNDLTVEHLVLEDVPDERRVFFGSAEARWKRDLLSE